MPNIRPAVLAFVVLFAACSKKDPNSGGSGQPSTYLTSFSSTAAGGIVTQTDVHYSASGTVSALIVLTTDTGVTTYTTILPVYGANGQLSELASAADSNETTGAEVVQCVYNGAGQLQKLIYLPLAQGPGPDPYDSLVWNASGHLAADYYYKIFGPGSFGLYSVNQLTWNSQNDVTQALLTSYTTPGGAPNNVVISYTYDGYNNPYTTVRDFALIMQQADGVGFLTGNNVTSARLAGFTTFDTTMYQYGASGLPADASLEVLNNGVLEGQPVPTSFQYNQ